MTGKRRHPFETINIREWTPVFPRDANGTSVIKVYFAEPSAVPRWISQQMEQIGEIETLPAKSGHMSGSSDPRFENWKTSRYMEGMQQVFKAYTDQHNMRFEMVDDPDKADTIMVLGKLPPKHLKTNKTSSAGLHLWKAFDRQDGSNKKDYKHYIVMNANYYTPAIMQRPEGYRSYVQTGIHEKGHRFGLEHPHNERLCQEVYHPTRDSHQYTNMSYKHIDIRRSDLKRNGFDDSSLVGWTKDSNNKPMHLPVTLMAKDIQELAGKRFGMSKRLDGDTIHTVDAEQNGSSTIYDPYGDNTLKMTAQGQGKGATISLQLGAHATNIRLPNGANVYFHDGAPKFRGYPTKFSKVIGSQRDETMIAGSYSKPFTGPIHIEGGGGNDKFVIAGTGMTIDLTDNQTSELVVGAGTTARVIVPELNPEFLEKSLELALIGKDKAVFSQTSEQRARGEVGLRISFTRSQDKDAMITFQLPKDKAETTDIRALNRVTFPKYGLKADVGLIALEMAPYVPPECKKGYDNVQKR